MNLNDRIWLRMNRKPATRAEVYVAFAILWWAVGVFVALAVAMSPISPIGSIVMGVIAALIAGMVAWTDYKGGYADALHKQALERRERKLAILKK